MNCFQIVSLIYWWQLRELRFDIQNCCELLSNCIFDLLMTTIVEFRKQQHLLWIAFKLYLWFIDDNCTNRKWRSRMVVNCFQIVSLIYWWQLCHSLPFYVSSCELLSNCIFDLLMTTKTNVQSTWLRLWIAFKLYLWFIDDNY